MTPLNRYIWTYGREPGQRTWQVLRHEQASTGGPVAGTAQVVVANLRSGVQASEVAHAIGHAFWLGRCQGGVS